MGIDTSDLRRTRSVLGISGVEECAEEEAYLVFTDADGGTNHYYNILALISLRDPAEVENLPSLLGRDVLSHWTMHYTPHPPEPSLTFDVQSDDLSLPTT